MAVNIKTFFLKGRYKNKVKPLAAVWRQVLAVCVIDKRSEPSCTKNPRRSVRTENRGGKWDKGYGEARHSQRIQDFG